MKMTMPSPAGPAPDFTNHPADGGWNPFITAIVGTESAWLLSPGAFLLLQRGRLLDFAAPDEIHTVPAREAMTAPAGLLITTVRESWCLKMTELAAILAVARPTLYSWLKDKDPSVSKVVLGHLRTLATAADVWNKNSDGGQQDFLLDYTGPQANEVSIRQAMSQPTVTAEELRALIKARCAQYNKALARTREILGDPMPLPATAPPESSRRLHEQWAKNTKALHSVRNTIR